MTKSEFEKVVHVAAKLESFCPTVMADLLHFLNVSTKEQMLNVDFNLAISRMQAQCCNKIEQLANE